MASKFNTVINSSSGTVIFGDHTNLRIGPGGQVSPVQEEKPVRASATRSTPVVHCQESSEDDNLTYKVNSGYVLIINNQFFPSREDVERSGSDMDVSKLKEFFEDVGLHPVQVRQDLDSSQMTTVLQEVAEKDFSKYDCFILVILSHGSSDGIHGTDSKPIQVDYITSLFRGSECPSLEGKPKVFFFQACRGSEEDIAAAESDSELISFSYPKLPADSDFLVCYASSPGLKSYRQPEEGSWFISTVVDVFQKYAGQEHLMDMMLRVNKMVASYCSKMGRKQMPSEVCMLTKKVYFNAPQFNQ